ncbi:MAG: diadenylate cyclase CdaA [Oscillospiraceae bacterium]|nr:diadenylate cyclase CdaA [Oscillospiraceae bacterium]
MEYLQTFIQALQGFRFTDALDIIIVAFLIYKLLPLLRSTGTTKIGTVIVTVIVVAGLTGIFKLHTLSWILNQLLAVGLLAVVVLFQPELRRMIDHLGKLNLKKMFTTQKVDQEMVPVILQTVRACEAMSREKVGALIVFARDNPLDEYMRTGTVIDGQVSDQLIRNIFFPKAALHDGAMIVRGGRVQAAACVLPLSESDRLSADLGTRHRAAVGMSEASDAVVVVVSEETGAISVAVGGMLKRHLAAQTLERLLRNELCPEETEKEENLVLKLRQKLQKKEDPENEK